MTARGRLGRGVRRVVSALADPERTAVRGAVRAALVLPGLFAIGRYVVGDQSFATFAVFGGFALLIMTDFGGTSRERLRSYLLATVCGAVLVALGTLASGTAVAAAATMFVVAVVITLLAAVVGGHIGTARLGLLLAFVLSVTLPPATTQIPARVGGWVFAGVAATLAGLLVLPRGGPSVLNRAAVAACRAAADLVDALGRDTDRLGECRDVAARAVAVTRTRFSATANRTIGSRRRRRAYAELIGDLQLLVGVAGHPLYRPGRSRRGTGTEEGLVAAVSGTLRASAAALDTAGEPPEVRVLERERTAHRYAMERRVRELLARSTATGQIVDALAVDHTVRVLAYLAGAVAGNIGVTANRTSWRPGGPGHEEPGDRRARHRHVEWLAPSAATGSTALRNSLRTGVGLALSVWIAGRLGLPHAFWVVLGTLQVLRTSALGTARSVARAVAGNVVGVAVGSALIVVTADRPALLWALLPPAVFLAAYTSGSQRLLLSQAAFTVDLLIIFNLLAPVGWRLGLIRLVDVGIGVALSVALSLLLWPHGARRQLVRTAAAYQRAATGQLRHALDRALTGRTVDRRPTPSAGLRMRAELALGDYLSERPSAPLDPSSALALVVAANYLAMAANLLESAVVEFGQRTDGCADVAEPVRSARQALLDRLERLADRLAGRDADGSPAPPSSDRPGPEAAVQACLDRWRHDEAVAGPAMVLVFTAEWIRSADEVADDLVGRVDRATAAAERPWWR
ncbi:FUSC family protein [Micromonospora costi]|nr:FUSC family protein [Micromonospora costi]